MIQNIIDNLKNQGIEIDLAQSNLIQKMIEALPQEKSFINKFKKSKLAQEIEQNFPDAKLIDIKEEKND